MTLKRHVIQCLLHLSLPALCLAWYGPPSLRRLLSGPADLVGIGAYIMLVTTSIADALY